MVTIIIIINYHEYLSAPENHFDLSIRVSKLLRFKASKVWSRHRIKKTTLE